MIYNVKRKDILRFMGKRINEIGNQYDRLTVFDFGEIKNNRAYWKCHCECDKDKPENERKVIIALGKNLRNGSIKSCGCLKRENILKVNQNRTGTKNPKVDLTNQSFTDLIALKRLETTGADGTYNWLCKCKCGNDAIFTVAQLNSKKKICCEFCNQQRIASKGEKIISELLIQNNIQFHWHYKDERCILDNNRIAEFDFFIDNKYLLEFDGEQHFRLSQTSKWNQGRHSLEKNQKYDAIKTNWCLDNNIPLIRIPYTHLNKLCIEDLLLETSSFIVREPVKVTSD